MTGVNLVMYSDVTLQLALVAPSASTGTPLAGAGGGGAR